MSLDTFDSSRTQRTFTGTTQLLLALHLDGPLFIALCMVGALGAYALVRLRWRGASVLSTAILFAYLMPTVMLFIPLYRIFTELHLVNTLGALMIASSPSRMNSRA